MQARKAVPLWLSLSTLTLLAACNGGEDPNPPPPPATPASITSVSPERFDLETDQPLDELRVQVHTSADPWDAGQNVCGTSSGADFVGVRLYVVLPPGVPVGSTVTEPNKDWVVGFEPDPGLSVEEHTGTLEVFLSSDQDCALRDGPSYTIPYRLSKRYGFTPPAAVTLTVGADTTAEEIRGSARIDVAGGPPQAWTARSLSPWLVVDTPAGVTGGEVQFHADPTLAASVLGDGGEGAQIEIAGDAEWMTPTSVWIQAVLAVPVAKLAMPTDQPAGPARRFRVRGTGFTEEAIAGGHLAMEGVPGAVFTRLGDLDLVVELPAGLPAGTYSFVTTDALGISHDTAVLRLTAPVETARTILPGDGANGHLLWDGMRNALFVLEPVVGTNLDYSYELRRHALSDGAWTTIEQRVSSLRRLGLSADGARLLGIADSDRDYNRTLYGYDPTRLAPEILATLFGVEEPASAAPLAVTVDGRVWSGSNNLLFALDPATTGWLPSYSASTWGWASSSEPMRTIASRDGGRLLVSRVHSGAFVVHDALGRLPFYALPVQANPAGLTTFDAIDDDGSRVLSGTGVYDQDFALVGTLPAGAILSGDGRRAFTLEYRSDWRAGGAAPLVHVLDLTAPAPGGGALPELGTVDLLDHATCAAGERLCAPTSSFVATPDGRVVFVQTGRGVAVVPIPETLVGAP